MGTRTGQLILFIMLSPGFRRTLLPRPCLTTTQKSLKGLGAGHWPVDLLAEPYGTAHLLGAKPNASFGGTSSACRWHSATLGAPFHVPRPCPVPVQVMMVACPGQLRACADRNQKGGVPVVLPDVPSCSQCCSPGHPHPERFLLSRSWNSTSPLLSCNSAAQFQLPQDHPALTRREHEVKSELIAQTCILVHRGTGTVRIVVRVNTHQETG